MASDSIIIVDQLGKKYSLRHQGDRRYTALRDVIADKAKNIFRRSRGNGQSDPTREEFWALKNVSFEVKKGEVVGIIGRNGAGKSTLLKILSRITEPTEGRVRIKGRVASLLEVGTGFHPELTGRENIFLNGAILGMGRVEIKAKFDEIIAFAEIEKFLDTPVKRYSSGMYVRLAFAVAAHLEPEILIVDEVLAVGDAQFQKKCLGKMGEVARGGRTVLFVSHNMIAVQTLCSKAFLIREGRLISQGSAASVVTEYLSSVRDGGDESNWEDPAGAPGSETLRIQQIGVSADGVQNQHDIITMDVPIRVKTSFWILKGDRQLHITYHLVNAEGITVLTTGSPSRRWEEGSHIVSFIIPGNLLNSGGYSLKLLIVQNESQVIFERADMISFVVADMRERKQAYLGREPSVIQPVLKWEVAMPTLDTAQRT